MVFATKILHLKMNISSEAKLIFPNFVCPRILSIWFGVVINNISDLEMCIRSYIAISIMGERQLNFVKLNINSKL